MSEYINDLSSSFTTNLTLIKKISHDLALKIKNEYTNFAFLLPLLKYVYVNPFLVVLFTLLIGFFLSNFVLSVLFSLLLINCIILSLLVLHNISAKPHSRRLAKNILSLFLLYFNPFGSIFTIIMAFFLYSNYNKIISRVIIKLIENIILFIFVNIPFLTTIYPDAKQIKYEEPIHSTTST